MTSSTIELEFTTRKDYCPNCNSIHETNEDLYNGEPVFGCQLVQAGFSKIEEPSKNIYDYLIAAGGTSEILLGPDGQYHEFHRKGNDWFSYFRVFVPEENALTKQELEFLYVDIEEHTGIDYRQADNKEEGTNMTAAIGEKWVNFYNKHTGKYLGGYTQEGTFAGELQSTLELKAYDNNIDVSDIEVRYETK